MIPDWLKWMLIGIGLAAVVFAAFVLFLKNQVARKTRELVRDRADIKLILDTSPVLIFYKDRDGKFLRVNKAFSVALEISQEEFIGKTVFDLYSPEIAQSMTDDDDAVFESGQPRLNIEEQYESATGLRWVRTDKIPVLDKDGKAVALVGFAVDITEHKRVEEALKSSETKYRRLFEAARDGILILNAETGLIIDVNPFMVEMLGFSYDEFLGKKIWELGLLRDIIANKENFIELQKKGFVRYEGLPLKTTAGLRLEVEFVSNVYEVDHKKVIQCNIRDITERKKAEQAQEKLSEALKVQINELETFSYGIAHDLKSPLISIEGFTRLLKEDMQNQKTENVKEDMRLLESGVRKMQGFLHSTLEYSRAGRLIKRTPNVSFSEILNEALQDYNEQISALGAAVIKAKAFPRVNVDRPMVVQVLANLIQNSIKYRNEGVPLKIEIGYETPNGEPVFFVRDNGIGIDAGEVGKVFDLFYRGTSHVEGSGIGLKIVKKIIEAHGGKIWVNESNSGQGGTTICFTLPGSNGFEKRGFNGKN